MMKVENIIFDFGGVLVDWNPRYLYKDQFDEESKMEHFLRNICTDEWNLEQDKGRSLSEATTLLQNKFPEFHKLIGLFYPLARYMFTYPQIPNQRTDALVNGSPDPLCCIM